MSTIKNKCSRCGCYKVNIKLKELPTKKYGTLYACEACQIHYFNRLLNSQFTLNGFLNFLANINKI